MLKYLFLLFVVIPITEIMLLMRVGDHLGVLFTVSAVVLTATVGVYLVRHEGIKQIIQLQQRLAWGEPPEQNLLEGGMLLIAGGMLLVPGFITDGIGFLFVFPWTRRVIARVILVRLQSQRLGAEFYAFSNRPGSSPTRPVAEGEGEGEVIEGEISSEPHEEQDPERRLG